MAAVPSLQQAIISLSNAAGQYRTTYFGKRLSYEEISEARNIIAEIRNAAIELQQQWDAFMDRSVDAEAVLKVLRPRGLRVTDVSKLMSALTNIYTVGTTSLGQLEEPSLFTLHFQRQCNTLREGDAALIQEDAGELQSSVDQVRHRIRDEIESMRAQMDLVSLYSQTVLTKRMEFLTNVLIALTAIVVIGTLVGAVAGLYSLFIK